LASKEEALESPTRELTSREQLISDFMAFNRAQEEEITQSFAQDLQKPAEAVHGKEPLESERQDHGQEDTPLAVASASTGDREDEDESARQLRSKNSPSLILPAYTPSTLESMQHIAAKQGDPDDEALSPLPRYVPRVPDNSCLTGSSSSGSSSSMSHEGGGPDSGMNCPESPRPEEAMIMSELVMLMDFGISPTGLRHQKRVPLATGASCSTGASDDAELGVDQSLDNLETIAAFAQADADELLARLDREEHEYRMAHAKLNEKDLGVEDDPHASMRENVDAAWENDDARLLLHSGSEIVSGLKHGGDLLGKSV
jgi:hypothetical protein